MLAGRPMVTMLKRLKNSRAELQIDALGPALAAAERRVFDEREVEVVEGRTAKGVAPQRPEAPLVRPRAARNVNRDMRRMPCVVAPWPK